MKLQSQDVSALQIETNTRREMNCTHTHTHTHNNVCFLHPPKQAKNYIRGLPKVPKKDLNTIFFKASSEGKAFLSFVIMLGSVVRVICV